MDRSRHGGVVRRRGRQPPRAGGRVDEGEAASPRVLEAESMLRSRRRHGCRLVGSAQSKICRVAWSELVLFVDPGEGEVGVEAPAPKRWVRRISFDTQPPSIRSTLRRRPESPVCRVRAVKYDIVDVE